MSKAISVQVAGLRKRIERSVGQAISPSQMRALALEAIDIIVKRTRLGYGVRRTYGEKERLPSLSARYIDYRRAFKRLSSTTSPRKSNITLTGRLLDSIGIKRVSEGQVVITALGTRPGGLTNADLVGHLENKGRPFLRVSDLEFKQLIRIYRKTFGDLLKRNNLIR